MFKIILIIALTLTAAALLSSCRYDNEEDLYPPVFDTVPCDTTNVTYNLQIKTFLDSKCATAGCHAAGQTSPDLSVYGAAQAMAANLVPAATNTNHSSRFTWTDCERLQFEVWCSQPNEY